MAVSYLLLGLKMLDDIHIIFKKYIELLNMSLLLNSVSEFRSSATSPLPNVKCKANGYRSEKEWI
ncbi:hypothetical protein HDU92_005034 [Lobulomyces angularis]|nr:hypothetical protein HDU92_005034 [Lobulomyces angularis]